MVLRKSRVTIVGRKKACLTKLRRHKARSRLLEVPSCPEERSEEKADLSFCFRFGWDLVIVSASFASSGEQPISAEPEPEELWEFSLLFKSDLRSTVLTRRLDSCGLI